MAEKKLSLQQQVINRYREIVESRHPHLLTAWPIVSGYNAKVGTHKDWLIIIFDHTGMSGITQNSNLGEIPDAVIGISGLDKANKNSVRARVERQFKVGPRDAVIFLNKLPNGNWDVLDEMDIAFKKHEFSMGLIPMKIFLSHKGADKPIVREFKKTLELLGFDPWLDEDAMSAGTELERALLKGFADSCAAIFFVTPSYSDEDYLATEIDYAIQEKRKKGERFAIITLVLGNGTDKGKVPELLHRYVWKEPASDLEALREIIKALPVRVGDAYWRQ